MFAPVMLAFAIGLGAATPCTVVEEVVAVVGTSPILASDLELARMVELVEPEPGEPDAAYRSRLLEARIRLELQFRYLEDTGALYRLSFDSDALLGELEGRLGSARDARLEQHGLTRGDLGELALRLVATRAYVDQRLRPRLTVSRGELETEYRRLVERELASGVGEVAPLDAIADQLEHVLLERKLNGEIELWLEQARARLPVTRFYP